MKIKLDFSCILIPIAPRSSLGQTEFATFDYVTSKFRSLADSRIEDPVRSLTFDKVNYPDGPFLVEQRLGSRVLRYFAATTLAMQLLDAPEPDRTMRQVLLQTNLGNYHPSMNGEILQNPTSVVQPHEKAVEKMNDINVLAKKANMGFVPDMIYLYNHRIGLYNSQTNSNLLILENFIEALQKYAPDDEAWVIIVINSTNGPLLSKDVYNLPVLDLYGRNIPGNEYPGINPLITSHFWSLVDKADNIFGLFSPRSGSADIAAFNSVNTFFWDEPTLDLALKEEIYLYLYGLKKDNFLNSDLAHIQTIASDRKDPLSKSAVTVVSSFDWVTQTLRCLQLSVIAVVGQTLVADKQGPDDEWSVVSPTILKNWLTGEAKASDTIKPGQYPKRPMDHNFEYTPQTWLYFTVNDGKRVPYDIRYHRSQFENGQTVGGTIQWLIFCDALTNMGYFDAKKKNG